MVGMFSYADVFNQPLHNWNVSNVEFMNSMFANAQAFNQPLNNWDVSNVEFMNSMFANAQAFNQPLNNWNTSSVVQMQHMFRNSQTFDQPLNNWDISNVAVFFKMFSGASAFNQDLSDWNIQGSNLSNFIGNSGMDAINYDLLIEKLVYQGYSNGTLGAESIKYCDAFKRLQLLNAGWTITDGGQAQDCNLNYVSGNVFYDALNDGCNPNDVEIPNYFVNVSNGSEETSFFIDEDGQYAIGLESGDYTLSVLKPNFTSSPTTQSVSFTGQDEILEDIDFCITANQQFEDLSVDIFPLEDAIPGFETDCQIIVANNGTQIEPNVQVSFEYDDNSQSFVSSTTIPTGNSSNLLTFEIVDLEPFSQDVFEITMVNAVPPTLNGGEVLSFTTQVTPDNNDNNIKDNVATHDQTVVNSYDPNDKMVVQGEQILDEDIDQYMDYRIRFQNLGTANALNVKITDTIDNHLDWTTFQPLSSSHDYRIEIVDGEQINYYFDNINLPFEDADPEGSNGYITYKIKPKPSVQIGDTFENTAYIYFDFNLPIITNTVVTTVVDELSIDGFDLSRIKIYPNPVKEKLNLSIPFEVNLNAVELFDIQGKLIKSFENKNELDFSSIQKGIYILRLDTDKGVYNYKVIKS
jgi:uncharacterized repeat protein (TIGR01451 family)